MKKVLLLVAGLCLSGVSICDALVDVNTWAEVVGMDEAKKPTLENVNAKLRTVFEAGAEAAADHGEDSLYGHILQIEKQCEWLLSAIREANANLPAEKQLVVDAETVAEIISIISDRALMGNDYVFTADNVAGKKLMASKYAYGVAVKKTLNSARHREKTVSSKTDSAVKSAKQITDIFIAAMNLLNPLDIGEINRSIETLDGVPELLLNIDRRAIEIADVSLEGLDSEVAEDVAALGDSLRNLKTGLATVLRLFLQRFNEFNMDTREARKLLAKSVLALVNDIVVGTGDFGGFDAGRLTFILGENQADHFTDNVKEKLNNGIRTLFEDGQIPDYYHGTDEGSFLIH